MGISAALIEDTKEDAIAFENILNSYSKDNNLSIKLDIFTSAEDFLLKYKKQYELIFLDIELPGQNGMETGHEIYEMDPAVGLVFVTENPSFAVSGYEIEALDYLLKPLNKAAFYKKFRRILELFERRQEKELILQNKDGIIRIKITNIFYVEVSGHHVVIHTNERNIDYYGTLKEFETRLSSSNFVKCNQCYLVNLAHVSSYREGKVVIGNDTLIVSRAKRKNFYDAFTRYLGE